MTDNNLEVLVRDFKEFRDQHVKDGNLFKDIPPQDRKILADTYRELRALPPGDLKRMDLWKIIVEKGRPMFAESKRLVEEFTKIHNLNETEMLQLAISVDFAEPPNVFDE